MPIDYSKWKNIEVSDDEDDTHPNIDNASLFRWRHQARVERMKEMNAKKQSFAQEREKAEAKLKAIRDRVEKEKAQEAQEELKKAEKEFEEAEQKFKDIEKEEQLQPWNVDTISKDGWEKTIINAPQKIKQPPATEEEKEIRYKEFVDKNESKIKKFGMLSKYDECKKFLLEDPDLCCEETANYLTLWCLNLEIEEKHSLMEHVAKQAIAMQYMLELAKQLDVDVRGCISSFFTRIQTADKQYADAFNDEIEAFKSRIRERAKVRVEMAMKQVEEEERQKRLGPGGLDPLKVLETLPGPLKECFETQDINKLQEVISEMDEKDARYHLKRCIDSGLWVPDARKAAEEDESVKSELEKVPEGCDSAASSRSNEKGEEDIYSEPEEAKKT